MIREDVYDAILEETPIQDVSYEEEHISQMRCAGTEFDHVTFSKCRFEFCDFSTVCFYHVKFYDCVFQDCDFSKCYFRDCIFSDCNADHGEFCESIFRHTDVIDGSYIYGNFSKAIWENGKIEGSLFQNSFMSENKLKKMKFEKVNFKNTDFFKTKLKGMDLSSCVLEGIKVSDEFSELKGIKIDVSQAVDMVLVFGIQIK